MVQDLDGPQVTFVSSSVALRPIGGLPAPKITAEQALAAAQEHEAGKGLTNWYLWGLVAVFDRGRTSTREAAPAWKCTGFGDSDSRTFHVDALTGEVRRWANDSCRATDTITGNITGKASPGTQPDSAFTGCVNSAATTAMPFALVQAFDDQMSELDSVFADASGDYELEVPDDAEVTVKASLSGPAWTMQTYDGAFIGTGSQQFPCATPQTPETASTVVTAPQSGVDLLLNPSPAQFKTAQVNMHLHMGKTWDYFKQFFIPCSECIPGLDDVLPIHLNLLTDGSCNGRYHKSVSTTCPLNAPAPRLLFEIANGVSPCVNAAYSTFVSHEYGHYLLHHMFDIEPVANQNAGFHEGWADTCGFLVHDTPFFAEDHGGCDEHVRDPHCLEIPDEECFDATYPDDDTHDMCDGDPHVRGLLLGAIWLDFRASAMDLEDVRLLHFVWSAIGSAPEDEGPCDSGRDQSADSSTFNDVFVADDDDANLANGTPNDDLICEIFESRNIFLQTECPDSAGRRCRADCDQSTGVGVLDAFDFMCFQSAYSDRESRACNMDRSTGRGVCDVFDFIAFQNAFDKGCP